ncbi:hypothetical protein P5G51_002820 [Virgibacillus sp. 179-BFC.A HS]|uniref:Uncharacterized protein n=1 Tax=Tigheibacillus jepli TaxID=3035914 RepID=A0ABU5CFX1_9BACI|nr:hypothetical protein [Virgibacillus sp. 179-BFC.A HS]MDY0404483.1 hypothetical protein [Virgibacillus sp. 179-BFC.A HS]
MSSIGVTIAYFYACFVAYRLFKWSDKNANDTTAKKGAIVAPWRKFLSLLGVISSIGFFLLLIVPGSPGFLATPSLIALAIWVAIGAIFFLTKLKSYRAIPKKELDLYILGDYAEEEDGLPPKKEIPSAAITATVASKANK